MSRQQIEEILHRVATGMSTVDDADKLRALLHGQTITAAVADH